GAAGIAIIRLLYSMGVRNIIMCDSRGAIYEGRPYGMNAIKEQVAKMTNINKEEGSLDDVLVDADVFIGVSVGGALTKDKIGRASCRGRGERGVGRGGGDES